VGHRFLSEFKSCLEIKQFRTSYRKSR